MVPICRAKSKLNGVLHDRIICTFCFIKKAQIIITFYIITKINLIFTGCNNTIRWNWQAPYQMKMLIFFYSADFKIVLNETDWTDKNIQKEINMSYLIVINNKRPMGHIAHLRKQFKSINTNDFIITLIKRIKKNIINFITIYCFFIWKNFNPPHPRMLCAKFGLKLAQWFWRRFLNFVNVF